jgi:hypothetical protein
VSPDEKKEVVRDFLRRCVGWADEQEIPKRISRVAASESPEDAARLHQWLTYKAFVLHALGEIDDGTLDAWFEDSASDPG